MRIWSAIGARPAAAPPHAPDPAPHPSNANAARAAAALASLGHAPTNHAAHAIDASQPAQRVAAAIPSDAVVSVFHYVATGNLATIVRTLKDDGATYHVHNELLTPTGTIATDSFFRRIHFDDPRDF